MPEKEHRCEGMSTVIWVRSDGYGWTVDSDEFDIGAYITHCPWCGLKLEEVE